jgi:hypothetical protein
MKKLFRFVQFGGNIGIIVISLVLVFMVLERYVATPTTSNQEKPLSVQNDRSATTDQVLRGKAVHLTSAVLAQDQKTVILYLSTTCHFCQESQPFYRRLIEAKNQTPFKIIAVFPQSVDTTTKYLDLNNIKVDQILNASLSSLGIDGTPTLLIVGGDGAILDSWRGKLTAERENEVLAKLAET